MTPEKLQALRREAEDRPGTVWQDFREMLDYIAELETEVEQLRAAVRPGKGGTHGPHPSP